jgi:hypothetical protein
VDLVNQAANSPDTNLLDLGFFRAIQSFNDAAPMNEAELIAAVEQAYWTYPKERLNRAWLTLQSCFNRFLELCGDNHYKIPHVDKKKLQRRGELPVSLRVTELAETWVNPTENDNTDLQMIEPTPWPSD